MVQEANFQKPPLTHLEPQLLRSREPKQVHLFHHRDVAKAKNLGSDTAFSRSPLNYDSKCTITFYIILASHLLVPEHSTLGKSGLMKTGIQTTAKVNSTQRKIN